MAIKRNNLMFNIGGAIGGRTAKTVSKSVKQPPVITIIVPPVVLHDYGYCGASTITTIGEALFNEVITQDSKTLTNKVANYTTNNLFNTNGYYGYIIYPDKFGVLESLKHNYGEEQLTAWINMGSYTINNDSYIFYRTYVPKAYQPNQTLVCY